MSTLPSQPARSFFPTVMYPSVALQPSAPIPFPMQPSAPTPVVVPASGTCAVAAAEGNITTYPPEDDGTVYTYASYGEDLSDHIFKLSPNNPDSWTLSLSIPTASKLTKPILRSVTYIIKYATTHDDGNSTVQADLILTTATCPTGILARSAELGVYRNGPGYGPRMVDSAKALCLSSSPAIKCNGGTAHWSHYIDHRRLLPNVQVVGTANLYLNFHVVEYPTAETRRFLAIEISAAWCDISEVADDPSDDETTGDVEDTGPDEAATLAAAKTEANTPAPPPVIAPPPPVIAEPPPVIATPPPVWTVPTISAAPEVADAGVRDLIKAKIKEFNLQDCPGGYGWNKTATGYKCGGGTHSLTFAQLGMK